MRASRSESGFTLLEVMITCAIIAILASVALPSLFGEGHKAHATAEVTTMFSDLRNRLDLYRMENGKYPASIGESTFHPAAPTSSGVSITPLPASWLAAKVVLTNSTALASCSYTWVSGAANDSSAIGTIASTRFGFATAPSVEWYYVLAWCDMDDSSAVDSYYFSSSVDPTILKVNEGN